MYAVKKNTTVDGEVSVNQPPLGFSLEWSMGTNVWWTKATCTHLDFVAKCGGECFCQNIMFIWIKPSHFLTRTQFPSYIPNSMHK